MYNVKRCSTAGSAHKVYTTKKISLPNMHYNYVQKQRDEHLLMPTLQMFEMSRRYPLTVCLFL